MKTILFLLLFCLTIETNAQVFVHLGASPIKGTIGTELQVNRFSISAGVKPNNLWSTGWFTSYSGSLNTYFNIKEALCYVSLGAATKGVVERNEFGMWTDPVPAGYIVFGTRYYPSNYTPVTDRLSFDIGAGWSVTKYRYRPEFMIEFCVNWKLFRFEK
jgi:hypothetical protein